MSEGKSMKVNPEKLKTMIKNKYFIGDTVWYNLPEISEPGIITDCLYSVYSAKWTYDVGFGPDLTGNYKEEELVSKKRIV